MEVKEIKKLVDLMLKNDLRELEIQDGDRRVVLKRGAGESVPTVTLSPIQATQLPAGTVAEQPAAPGEPAAKPSEEQEFESIVSPMVGTFYESANPESPAYVNVGDTITAETVVCIVEAMKVMNEIKADMAGTIEKVMVRNGEAVEFGQPMFMVRSA
ncbi:MAG: acetyl-CoA carboxylase biotin carboxyl carrier protein [Actinobacteria bacterium]|nr:acetyl-CoA carboxylase biotin carboxyl carrier protein [Actinomycetota bacterium]